METVDPLFKIIQTLRGEQGCAWDRKQTPETMWKCLAEEVYELEEAIVKKDLQNICEELGDASVSTKEELDRQWEAIKKEEKKRDIKLADLSRDQKDRFWGRAKQSYER